VYRSANAEPADWIMVSTHDTPSLWQAIEEWRRAGASNRHARYLAERLEPEPRERGALAGRLAADPRQLAHAHFADLFTGPAQNILVFFTDLFGETTAYNVPGTISEANWTLRLSSNYADTYRVRLRAGRALNLPWALALALCSRGQAFVRRHRRLLAALDAHAACLGETAIAPRLKRFSI
jgi:hypothetical protein